MLFKSIDYNMSNFALNYFLDKTFQNMQTVADTVDTYACDALIQEVKASPKPGLVDRYNSGAHSDMDIHTFILSVKALQGFFGDCFLIGYDTQNKSRKATLENLQKLGRSAEEKMLTATNGINTHKGLIFSLGILCGAIGRLYGIDSLDEARIRKEAANISMGITASAFCDIQMKSYGQLTKGEKMFLQHKMTGARGEAESGFSTVGNISMPIFNNLMKKGISVNDALVETLLHLIAFMDDTNIASRIDMETALYAKEKAKECIREGGYIKNGGKKRVEELDRDFIDKNISPGGSADMLAVTYFLYTIHHKFYKADFKLKG